MYDNTRCIVVLVDKGTARVKDVERKEVWQQEQAVLFNDDVKYVEVWRSTDSLVIVLDSNR